MARVNSNDEAKKILIDWLRKMGVKGTITILKRDVLAPDYYPNEVK